MIESTENIDINTKKFKCKCDKSGVLFERIKEKEPNEFDVKLSNTETAFCDAEIPKFVKWLKAQGHGGDCWCIHIKEYINASI